MKMDYYSGVTGRHYISEEYKRQGELEYIANIEKQKLQELKKLNKDTTTYIDMDTDTAIQPNMDIKINSKEDLKQLVLKQLYEHQMELKEYESDLKFIKKYENLNKQLRQLRKQGFFKYLFNAGPIQRQINELIKRHKTAKFYINDPSLIKQVKEDLPDCIAEAKKVIQYCNDILAEIK